MLDFIIGMYLYRIVTKEEYPRQKYDYHIIKAPYDFGDFEEVKGFENMIDAIKYIENLKKIEENK